MRQPLMDRRDDGLNMEKETKGQDVEKEPVLKVHNLKSYYVSVDGAIPAVDGVDLTLYPGEIVGTPAEIHPISPGSK